MSKTKKLTEEEIKARHRVVCICKAISYGRIVDAIAKGCSTREELKKAIGAGTGDCGATRCGPVIEELLRKFGRSAASSDGGDK